MRSVLESPSEVASTLSEVVEVFDTELRSDLPFVNRLLTQIQGYRGKLLRPKLLLLSAEAAGRINPEHVTLGAVVEMVHMATLVHDDVLDEADVRRHGRAVNRLMGNEGAVLLGDYLISHAYHLCSSLGSTHASRRIAAVTNTVCEGELMQIENRGNFALTEAEYIAIIRRKTGALTSVCCELGGQAAGADTRIVAHLAAFGLDLGIAFQIVDDLLDLTAKESDTGKSVGRDADMGKLTLPLIRFLSQAEEPKRSRLMAVLADEGIDKSASAREMLNGSDAIAYARGVARRQIEAARSRLDELPAGDAKDALCTTAEFVLDRNQ